MSTLSLRHGANVSGNSSLVYGDKTNDISISVTLPAFHIEDSVVADNYGSAILWTSGDGNLSSFTFGLLLSDVDIYIERKNSKGTPEYVLDFVPANVPYYFGGKVSGSTTERLDGALLVSGTDYSLVARIEVQNNVADDIGDATVSLYLFT